MLKLKVTIACLISVILIAGYVVSRHSEPETVIIYKETPYERSPKTEVQANENNLLNSKSGVDLDSASTNDLLVLPTVF